MEILDKLEFFFEMREKRTELLYCPTNILTKF